MFSTSRQDKTRNVNALRKSPQLRMFNLMTLISGREINIQLVIAANHARRCDYRSFIILIRQLSALSIIAEAAIKWNLSRPPISRGRLTSVINMHRSAPNATSTLLAYYASCMPISSHRKPVGSGQADPEISPGLTFTVIKRNMEKFPQNQLKSSCRAASSPLMNIPIISSILRLMPIRKSHLRQFMENLRVATTI